MAKQFASGKRALGVCDICGFVYKLTTLRDVYVKRRNTNLKACSQCWDSDHPQLQFEDIQLDDPQALRDPRSDSNTYAQSRALIIPVYTVVAAASLGRVTVSEA
jgi:hypothetical protein